jgi:nitroreductase
VTSQDAQGDEAARTVLEQAIEVARHAPSVHNTQPWRWRPGPDRLDLYAVRERQLEVADPDGHLLLMSCGAALHHAEVALTAAGRRPRVTRLPSPVDRDHLATLEAGGSAPPDAQARRLVDAVADRRTDRRPVADDPVPAERLDELLRAVRATGTQAHVVRPDQVITLTVVTADAEAANAQEPAARAELARWVGGSRPDRLGVPDAALPEQRPETRVPVRDLGFGHAGDLPVGEGHDRSASYLVLHGDSDDELAWLRAGEALSALWLTATALGLSVLPFSAPIELVGPRSRLARSFGLDYPYLAVRVGVPRAAAGEPPRTPRLGSEEVVG